MMPRCVLESAAMRQYSAPLLGLLAALGAVAAVYVSPAHLLSAIGILAGLWMLPKIGRRPEIGLYGFLLTYPLNAFTASQEVLTLSIPNMLLLITSAAVLARFKEYRLTPPIRRVLLLLPIFLAASLAGVLMAEEPLAALRGMATRIGYCLTILVLVTLLNDWERIKRVLRYIIMSATLASAATVLLVFFPSLLPSSLQNVDETESLLRGLPSVRPTALFVNVHPFASWSVYALAVCAIALLSPQLFGIRKRWTGLALFLLSLGLLVNQTRIAWVSVLVTMLLALCLAPWYLAGKRKTAIALLAMTTVVGLSFISPQAIADEVLAGEREQSTVERVIQYQIAFNIVAEHPWIGIGPGAAANDLEAVGLHHNIHNIFLEELVAFGIVGFIPYIAFLPLALIGPIKLLLSAQREQRLIGTSLLLAAIAALIVYQVYSGVGEKSYWVMLGLSTASSRLYLPPHT